MSSREKTPDMTPPAPAGTPFPSPAVIFMPPPALQVTFSRPAGQPPRLRVHAPAAAGPGRPAAGAVPAAGPDEAPGDPIFQGLAGSLARPVPLMAAPARPGPGVIGAWDAVAGTYVGYPATAVGRVPVTPSTYLADADGGLYMPHAMPDGQVTIPAAPNLSFFVPRDLAEPPPAGAPPAGLPETAGPAPLPLGGAPLAGPRPRADAAPGGPPGWDGACGNPVFVLCCARSGSTLLRFLLDAHPDLACPPETNAAALCAHLASMWSLLAGAPVPADSRGGPPEIPGPALTGIRRSMDAMIGPYLARRGKARYCDKSLGAAEHADLLVRLFPAARFICLYRHPMDVIASGLEASPWGLTGFGFDRYAAQSPANAVLALARFWADHTAAIQAVEARYPDRCHRVRYEDLVTDPEAEAGQIFRFLGVAPQPGISGRCLAPERERDGRSDYKIWHTSRITADSAGRGWSVPATLIEPTAAARVNDLAARLGYLPVDETWGVADTAPDFRRPAAGAQAAGPAPADDATAEMPRAFLLIGDLLQAGMLRISDRFARRWGSHATESFLVIATSAAAGGSVRWRVDLAARTVSLARGSQPEPAAAGAAWQVTGEASAWEPVIRGAVNLNVALRRRDLRYGSAAEPAAVSATRMSMLADLLGITSWRPPEAARAPQDSAAPARA
jgi:protein-tyrosine sulfotransferase